eukprot:6181498-Pleurochrysis_carterae.AAC.1
MPSSPRARPAGDLLHERLWCVHLLFDRHAEPLGLFEPPRGLSRILRVGGGCLLHRRGARLGRSRCTFACFGDEEHVAAVHAHLPGRWAAVRAGRDVRGGVPADGGTDGRVRLAAAAGHRLGRRAGRRAGGREERACMIDGFEALATRVNVRGRSGGREGLSVRLRPRACTRL